MGRRHDWTLRPELMRRKAVPVGNWPTVSDIPPGALVLDSDGVVKQKVGDFLIPVPVTIIGSGPIASAPNASLNDGQYFYDNVTSVIYRSVDGEWVGVNAWLMVGNEYVTRNGENINVDDPNLIIIVDESGLVGVDESGNIIKWG